MRSNTVRTSRRWVLMLCLMGCANPTMAGRTPPAIGQGPAAEGLVPASGAHVPPLVGQVEPLADGTRRVQATLTEVGSGATVSLIDPATGNTIASALTSPSGAFELNFGNTFFPGTAPYFLEAVKGLSVGLSPNRAGASNLRLRTLISWQSGSWISLTRGNLDVNESTTTLCALSDLENLSVAQNGALMNTVEVHTPSASGSVSVPDTFLGTPNVTLTDFFNVWGLVHQSLLANTDPIATLAQRPGTGFTIGDSTASAGYTDSPGYAWGIDGWTVSAASPSSATIGTLVTLYGSGFPTATDSVTVSVDGLGCTVASASADGTWISFNMHAGFTNATYPVIVTYGPWTNDSIPLTLF